MLLIIFFIHYNFFLFQFIFEGICLLKQLRQRHTHDAWVKMERFFQILRGTLEHVEHFCMIFFIPLQNILKYLKKTKLNLDFLDEFPFMPFPIARWDKRQRDILKNQGIKDLTKFQNMLTVSVSCFMSEYTEMLKYSWDTRG